MIRMMLAAFLLSVALTASSKAKLLEHIPLQWRPTSALQLGTAQMTGDEGEELVRSSRRPGPGGPSKGLGGPGGRHVAVSVRVLDANDDHQP